MNVVAKPRRGQTVKRGKPVARASARLTTTLYDVMATLQTVTEPDEDDLVVAVVVQWLRTGRLSFGSKVTVAA